MVPFSIKPNHNLLDINIVQVPKRSVVLLELKIEGASMEEILRIFEEEHKTKCAVFKSKMEPLYKIYVWLYRHTRIPENVKKKQRKSNIRTILNARLKKGGVSYLLILFSVIAHNKRPNTADKSASRKRRRSTSQTKGNMSNSEGEKPSKKTLVDLANTPPEQLDDAKDMEEKEGKSGKRVEDAIVLYSPERNIKTAPKPSYKPDHRKPRYGRISDPEFWSAAYGWGGKGGEEWGARWTNSDIGKKCTGVVKMMLPHGLLTCFDGKDVWGFVDAHDDNHKLHIGDKIIAKFEGFSWDRNSSKKHKRPEFSIRGEGLGHLQEDGTIKPILPPRPRRCLLPSTSPSLQPHNPNLTQDLPLPTTLSESRDFHPDFHRDSKWSVLPKPPPRHKPSQSLESEKESGSRNPNGSNVVGYGRTTPPTPSRSKSHEGKIIIPQRSKPICKQTMNINSKPIPPLRKNWRRERDLENSREVRAGEHCHGQLEVDRRGRQGDTRRNEAREMNCRRGEDGRLSWVSEDRKKDHSWHREDRRDDEREVSPGEDKRDDKRDGIRKDNRRGENRPNDRQSENKRNDTRGDNRRNERRSEYSGRRRDYRRGKHRRDEIRSEDRADEIRVYDGQEGRREDRRNDRRNKKRGEDKRVVDRQDSRRDMEKRDNRQGEPSQNDRRGEKRRDMRHVERQNERRSEGKGRREGKDRRDARQDDRRGGDKRNEKQGKERTHKPCDDRDDGRRGQNRRDKQRGRFRLADKRGVDSRDEQPCEEKRRERRRNRHGEGRRDDRQGKNRRGKNRRENRPQEERSREEARRRSNHVWTKNREKYSHDRDRLSLSPQHSQPPRSLPERSPLPQRFQPAPKENAESTQVVYRKKVVQGGSRRRVYLGTEDGEDGFKESGYRRKEVYGMIKRGGHTAEKRSTAVVICHQRNSTLNVPILSTSPSENPTCTPSRVASLGSGRQGQARKCSAS